LLQYVDFEANETMSTQWRNQAKNFVVKNFGGFKMFDFRRITLFCLEKRLSKHK